MITVKSVILFIIMAILWVMVVFNYKLKRDIKKNRLDLNTLKINSTWGNFDCACDTPRIKWRPLAVDRPGRKILFRCPQCQKLYEERMDTNKWRLVDDDYAKDQYNYKCEGGSCEIDI